MLGADEISACNIGERYIQREIVLQIVDGIVNVVLILVLGVAHVGMSRQKEEEQVGVALENIFAQSVDRRIFFLYLAEDIVDFINNVGVAVEVHKRGK